MTIYFSMEYVILHTMLNKLLSFFVSPKPVPAQPAEGRKNYLVIFDGDQIGTPIASKILGKHREDTKYIWIQTKDEIPNKLKKHLGSIELRIAPKVGKESADTLVALLACKEACTNPDIKEIHIMSGDGDIVDMCMSLSTMFPAIMFFAAHPSTRAIKKVVREAIKKLPSNCKFVRISA